MRIALETKTPLPQYKCWYAYDAKKNATVNDLRRAINKDLKLVKSSRDLELKGGPYAFLPQLSLKGLIQEDDIITIKFDKHKKKRVVKTTVRAKVEKSKKGDKLSTLDKKSSKEKKRKASDNEDEKPTKKRKEKAAPSPSNPVTTTSSSDGLTKTQKRNRRKAIKRIKEREEQQQKFQEQQQEQPIETKNDENDIATTSEHLLKFNKNKRKDFLKVQNKKKREHVRFDGINEEEAPDEFTTAYDQYDAYDYEQDQNEDQENLYGAAYVTSIEADQRYKGEKKGAKSYPIDHMGDHFYAEAPPSSAGEELMDQEEDVQITQETSQQEQQQHHEELIQRNYEELPKLEFSGSSIPAVGDLIAFKLLSMTEAYTPEISDWKEAKVLSLDNEARILVKEAPW
ncbi:hypothetical protein K492DRAFT_237154 [Lichtheimia hyalospora FSU 10163]|nr:hypothetical protein K492DRAFT_237154 [Lichtheimia hyalospora FSU 10163]